PMDDDVDVLVYVAFVFFFSSRRRHTRFDCDWSSDVCSSDLTPTDQHLSEKGTRVLSPFRTGVRALQGSPFAVLLRFRYCTSRGRSEERRVGKECRSRWAVEYVIKKRGWWGGGVY